MEVVIVDQEAGSRSRIARHFEALPGWDVVGQYQFDRKAVAGIRRARPPVVVIGLSPDHTSSLGWIRSLADTRIPPAILIVGYGNAQALTAFEVGATGYLCRPVTRNALINALGDLQRITLPLRGSLSRWEEARPRRRFITITDARGTVTRIPVENVRYFEAGHKCTTIHHLGGKTLTKESLLSFERSFGNHVLRCHRSILVATRWIDAMERAPNEKHVLRLRGMDTPVAVSRRGAREVRRLLEHEKGARGFITRGRFGVRRVWAGDGIEMTTQSSEARGL